MPSLKDLNRCMSTALASPGKHFELNWSAPNRDNFNLDLVGNRQSATCTLFKIKGHTKKSLWTRETIDFMLIHKLLIESQNVSQISLIDPTTAVRQDDDFVCPQLSAETVSCRPKQPAETASQISNFMDGEAEDNQLGEFPERTQLNSMIVPNLFRLAAALRSTGKLCLRDLEQEGYIYFVDGVPSHAVLRNARGHEAIIQLIGWKSGIAYFREGTKTTVTTVYKSSEQLIEEGIALMEHSEYLDSFGFTANSTAQTTLIANVSEVLEQIAITSEVPADNLMSFYSRLDSSRSLLTQAKEFGFEKSQFLKITHFMLQNKLLLLQTRVKHSWTLPEKTFDRDRVNDIHTSLCDPDSGLYTYSAFLYLLHFEYLRSFRARSPLAVLLFAVQRDGVLAAESAAYSEDESKANILTRILRLKRGVDVLSLYDGDKFALLLPNTTSKGAQCFAAKIHSAAFSHLESEFAGEEVRLFCGSSSIPEDTYTLSQLLTAAEFALSHAIAADKNFVAFNEISPAPTCSSSRQNEREAIQ